MHLQNALINIAVNAQDAMPNGGTLTFEVANVCSLDSHLQELAGDDVGDHVLVAVTDTGDGIAPDVLERVFEPFFTTKGLANNSGLGLSVVQGFVQQSGGVIDAQSTPGKGTSLRLYLPRAPITRDVDTEPAPQRRSADAEGRILLVEDDDAVRDSLRMLLEISGYSVIEAADGETAFHLVCLGNFLVAQFGLGDVGNQTNHAAVVQSLDGGPVPMTRSRWTLDLTHLPPPIIQA
ncbi:MAG: hypothetical protein CMM08_17770 [Rhodospirillaceae bacterium]|nr:hypothetical protein [Rhodospirillaceae bacterium]